MQAQWRVCESSAIEDALQWFYYIMWMVICLTNSCVINKTMQSYSSISIACSTYYHSSEYNFWDYLFIWWIENNKVQIIFSLFSKGFHKKIQNNTLHYRPCITASVHWCHMTANGCSYQSNTLTQNIRMSQMQIQFHDDRYTQMNPFNPDSKKTSLQIHWSLVETITACVQVNTIAIIGYGTPTDDHQELWMHPSTPSKNPIQSKHRQQHGRINGTAMCLLVI